MKESEELFEFLDEHIRNIYELIDTETPMWALYELNKFGAEGLDLTDEEYELAKKRTITACHNFYKKDFVYLYKSKNNKE